MDETAAMKLVAHIPLSQAMLCLQCDALFASGPDQCPSCAGLTFLLLSTWIQPMQFAAEVRQVQDMRICEACGVPVTFCAKHGVQTWKRGER